MTFAFRLAGSLTLLMTLTTSLNAAPPPAARIAVHGHRGARAVRPENTLPAFTYAAAQGVEVLEMDMAVTKDNIIVLSHDPEMNAKYCSGPANAPRVIRQMTLAELRQWDCGGKVNPEFPRQQAIPGTRVPTLDEVFAATKASKVQYNIETKIFRDKPELTPPPEEFARLFEEVVKRHGLESRVILQSFDPRTLVAMSRRNPRIRLSMLTPDSPASALRSWIDACREGGSAKIVSPNHLTVTRARVDEAHAAGLQVVPWTANTADQWAKLIDAGVDAIITDDPEALIAHLKSRQLR
jgi:glycerophosphoryl diester phosphodiesterase